VERIHGHKSCVNRILTEKRIVGKMERMRGVLVQFRLIELPRW
jgi:hypothetical protein